MQLLWFQLLESEAVGVWVRTAGTGSSVTLPSSGPATLSSSLAGQKLCLRKCRGGGYDLCVE